MIDAYIPILLFLLVAIGFALVTIGLAWGIGPSKYNKVKLEPYECGIETVGDARDRYSVRYYLVAMLFVIFDIETVFMIPWGAYYRQLSCAVPLVNGACPTGNLSFFGLGEMLVFMVILLAGYIYIWKRGPLQGD